MDGGVVGGWGSGEWMGEWWVYRGKVGVERRVIVKKIGKVGKEEKLFFWNENKWCSRKI